MQNDECIRIRGAREHNLKDLDLDIPTGQLVVVTGLSGSGKSSLAFDTIYAEGQRRYVESLSAYARQFLDEMQKPDVDHIEGLPPAIAIEQRLHGPNPRSTVATTTEVYDYLRLLYARCGTPHCPKCGRAVTQQSADEIIDEVLRLPGDTRFMVLAPLIRGQRGEHKDILRRIQREGFVRVRINGDVYDVKTPPPLAKTKRHTIEAVIDRMVIRPKLRARLADSIEMALRLGEGLVVVSREGGRGGWTDTLYSQQYACPTCHVSFDELTPRSFSFNSPYGACPACDGIGTRMEFDEELLVTAPGKPLAGGAIDLLAHQARRLRVDVDDFVARFAREAKVDASLPWAELPAKAQKVFLYGPAGSAEALARHNHHGNHGHHHAPPVDGVGFPGLVPLLRERFEQTGSEAVRTKLMETMSDQPCPVCKGARLRAEALSVTVADRTIGELVRMSIAEAAAFVNGLELKGQAAIIGAPILRHLRSQLRFMDEVGVGYLTLDRMTQTLAGGEAQRVRLASQVGSGLVGVCYVLDEPTIGLHPRDNERLLTILRDLRDMGNSLLVVEHDEDTILAADHVIDMGPGAGATGGNVVCQGPVKTILKCSTSLTGTFLSGKSNFTIPSKRRPVSMKQAVTVRKASEHNLKKIDVAVPLGAFTCVTGVSGSGKSTLVGEILLPALRRELGSLHQKPGRFEKLLGAAGIDKVIEIDQSPIGRTPRSNAATYTGVFDLIRNVFVQTKDAKIRGYKPGRFSFNVMGGRCETCQGQGVKKIEMHFLPDLFVVCQQCHGARYNRETLEIRYRGRNIADVLDMSVTEALSFFENYSKIVAQLTALNEVGLGYIKIGQPSTTLSGGEAQRVKLAAELGKVATGRTLYVLDEPTTGLHFADIQQLLSVLARLVDRGNTVLVIEHNLEVIAHADWIVDLGPEGGDAGGQVVATGTPEQLSEHPTSHTGRYLKEYLARHASRRG
jgi:excinuclease ABC subunit A